MKSAPLHFTLIAAATLSAFTLGPAVAGVRDQLAKLFEPVAAPTRAIGLWTRSRVVTPSETDLLSPDKARSPDELLRHNAILLTQVQNLQAQIDDLKGISAGYQKLGRGLQSLVEPAGVINGPAANRQTLTINTSNLSAVRERMAVVEPRGFVGTIYSSATVGGTARVLLATDPESHIQARFVRVSQGADGRVTSQALPIDLIDATGDGRQIVARMISPGPVRDHLQVGDFVLVDDDKTFGPALKGLRLGTVRTIDASGTARFASVEIDPVADLPHLNEVLVVTRTEAGAKN